MIPLCFKREHSGLDVKKKQAFWSKKKTILFTGLKQWFCEVTRKMPKGF
jgi:hypothetical protein